MEITFVIDWDKDDTGTYKFYARRPVDFDVEGIPISNVFVGNGDTESEAIVSLLDVLDMHGMNLV